MRPWSLILLAVVAGGCKLRVPRGVGLPIAARVTVRAQTTVTPPPPPVAMVGAPVPEFFGIPLEGASEVVFALDVSGSMNDNAQGQVAQLAAPPPSPSPSPSDTPSPPPSGSWQPAPGAAPTDPTQTPPDAPPPPSGAPPPPGTPAPVRSSKIEVAKAELIDALKKLPTGTRVNVIFFDSDVEGFAPDVVPLDEATRASLIGYVSAEFARGSTALSPAMRTALMMQTRRVVLLSDGLGNVGGGADAVLRDAREAIRGGTRIDTVGLGTGQDATLLGTLAGESGGLYQAL
ncbi:MAG TPA: hypothetical protein VLT45_22430 [Kofleriaceae bacterium]|nr:hypothetical protein [Kofleriaceae bacterium]